MEFLYDFGLFAAKAITIVIAFAVVLGLIVSAGVKNKRQEKGQITITKLNEKFEAMKEALQEAVLDSHALKTLHKDEKKREKAEKKAQKQESKQLAKEASTTSNEAQRETPAHKKRVFVLNFDGDIKASANDQLRECITAVLTLATPNDEVVVRLESGGGMVHSYGLASSQLARITNKDIPLTVTVDKVAASGGYMMACVADQIVAAPFAIIGSIGVVAQIPNIHRLLKKHDVDVELHTAGEYKRTLTMLGENTDKGREKFVEDLEDTHQLFKDFVQEHRTQLDLADVATGEIWFGRRALEKQLVDQIKTSDEYLQEASNDADVFEVDYEHKKTVAEKLGLAAEAGTDRLLMRWWDRLSANRYWAK